MIPVIDMHCDTISVIHNKNFEGEQIALRKNHCHLDLEKMKEGGYMCQNFALFTYLGHWMDLDSMYFSKEVKEHYPTAYDYAMDMSDTFDREIEANRDLIGAVRTASDIEENFLMGRMSALKTVEEGAVYEGSVDRLKEFYDKGVRMTTLTWNFENELASPNQINWTNGLTVPDTIHGLKQAGRELVDACRELGVIVDVSHLNDAGIYDILDIMKGKTPIVASHSNARGVTNHARNLSDEMLRSIAEGGGVAGINFCNAFLNDRDDNKSAIQDMIRHIKYMENVAGIDAIGLGSDFDGIENTVELGNGGGMQRLAEALEDAGYSHEKIEKIFYKNVLRVYREVLK